MREPRTAVLVHHVVLAERAMQQAEAMLAHAERMAAEAGFTMAAIRRAVAMLEQDARAVESEHLSAGVILCALDAPGVEVEMIEVVERFADEDPIEAVDRATRAGYCAAILDRPHDGGSYSSGSNARAAWSSGFRAFQRDLKLYRIGARISAQHQAVAA